MTPDASTTTGARLAEVIRHESLEMARAWRGARAGRGASLRLVRIATRRLREALALAETIVDARSIGRLRRTLRRVTRALGPMREIEVSLEELAAAAERHHWPAPFVTPIRRRLERVRRERRVALLARLAKIDRRAIARQVAAVAAALQPLDAVRAERSLVTRVLRRSADVRRVLSRCGVLYAPERWHALRIAVKKLRYTLELEGAIGHQGFAEVTGHLAAVQRRLGQLHDQQMLLAEARAAAGRARAHEQAAVATVVDVLERECLARHAAILPELATVGTALGDVRRLSAEAALRAAPMPRRVARAANVRELRGPLLRTGGHR